MRGWDRLLPRLYALGPRNPYPGYAAGGPRQGTGPRYRLTALGPGVTAIVAGELPSPGDCDGNDPAKAQAERRESTRAEPRLRPVAVPRVVRLPVPGDACLP